MGVAGARGDAHKGLCYVVSQFLQFCPNAPTYAAQNLVGILGAHKPEAELYYWRERGGREVDFVVESDRRVVAVETKWASRLRPRDWRGLEHFRDQCPACVAGLLAYSGEEVAPLGQDLWAVPLPVLWG